MEKDYQIVICNCPSAEIARKLAELLLKEKLAACVNIVPGITSLYWWEGAIETSAECCMLIKSISSLFSEIEKLIQSNHPYEIPEIIAIPVTKGSKDYLEWINSCLI